MGARKLYEDMSAVGVVYIVLSQAVDAALRLSFTLDDYQRCREEVAQLTGLQAPHPAYRATVAPLAEAFLDELKAWLSHKKITPNLIQLSQVIGGEQAFVTEQHIEAEALGSMKEAPAWYQNLIDVGRERLENQKWDEKMKERMGGLIRKVPADTILGYVAHDFLKQLGAGSLDSQHEKLWAMFKGEKSLDCRIKIQGLYSWVEVQ